MLSSAVWFAGTAVAPDLVVEWGLDSSQSAALTSATQFGFIAGTLLFALLNLADRFSARRVFLASALSGVAINAGFAMCDGLALAVALRFLTGVALAGIYPVGMKIVASWSDTGLGLRLGIMVGALGVGTALPYLMQWAALGYEWRVVVWAASALAALGAMLVHMGVSEGPRLRARARFDARAFWRVFGDAKFRWNAFGYLGHMWELYAVWSLQLFFLREALPETWHGATALIAFGVVAIGAFGCLGGGLLSQRIGERRVALYALMASSAMCLLSPMAFTMPSWALVVFMLLWGVVIVADSPQFSTLATRHCPPEYTGTALTVQNGLGFAVTVISIQLVAVLAEVVGWRWVFLFLAPGPLFGAWSMARLRTAAS